MTTSPNPSVLRLVRPDHVPDDGPAQRTVAAADAAPLLDRTVVAHAHVAAHVQYRVDRLLEADGAIDARCAVDGSTVGSQADRTTVAGSDRARAVNRGGAGLGGVAGGGGSGTVTAAAGSGVSGGRGKGLGVGICGQYFAGTVRRQRKGRKRNGQRRGGVGQAGGA